MADCQKLSSHTDTLLLITKDNYMEIVPDNFELTDGTKVTVSCLDSLRLVGDKTFSCNNGAWSYSSKPYCTNQPEDTSSSLDEDTKIMIGVVCAVAAIIIITLIVMIVAVWLRDRRRRKEKERMEDAVYRGDDNRRYGSRDGVSTIDMEMYGRRGVPPPPYQSSYVDSAFIGRQPDYVDSDRGYRSRDRDYDRDSRLGNRMYFPAKTESYRDYYDDIKKNRQPKRKTYDDDYSDPGSKPYVRDWVRRSSRNRSASVDYLERPYVHGRGGRDSRMW